MKIEFDSDQEARELRTFKENMDQQWDAYVDNLEKEVRAWRQWAATYFERCEEAAPDEYEYIRNEIMETCRPYAGCNDT